ncbi:MAG: rhomboid family intramembrane serine protease [Luteibaculaceae bacterium]
MQNNTWDQIKSQFNTGSALSNLIIINVAVFIFVNLIDTFAWLVQSNSQGFLSYWLATTADPLKIITKPWSIFTYNFMHAGLFHLLINMLILYFGGRIFTEFLGPKRLVATFIWGGVAGWLLYFTFYNIFPVYSSINSTMVGASAGVMAVLIGIATFMPNYAPTLVIFGPVKLKWIALFYIFIDIMSIRSGNSGGHLAHLGGALFGFITARSVTNGSDYIAIFCTINAKVGNFFSSLFKRKPKRMTVRYRNVKANVGKQYQSARGNANADGEGALTRQEREEKINEILDKISRSGYDSLSKSEKEFLFNASNENK